MGLLKAQIFIIKLQFAFSGGRVSCPWLIRNQKLFLNLELMLGKVECTLYPLDQWKYGPWASLGTLKMFSILWFSLRSWWKSISPYCIRPCYLWVSNVNIFLMNKLLPSHQALPAGPFPWSPFLHASWSQSIHKSFCISWIILLNHCSSNSLGCISRV